jgi:hypothetical protein
MKEKNNEMTIGDLEQGKEGWTLPESIMYSKKGSYHIDLKFQLVDKQEGMYQVRVWRDNVGYHARLFVPRRYDPKSHIPMSFITLRTFEKPI